MVISSAVLDDAPADIAAEQRSLILKGYADPVNAYVATLAR